MKTGIIYNENCLETMRRMEGGSIDLIVTSPPYDKMRDYKGFKFPFRHIARHIFRIMKEGGVVVWVVNDQTINGSESLSSFRQVLFFNEIGFRVHDTMIYAKENYPPLNHNRYEPKFEYMFVLSKGRPKTFNPIMVPCKTAGMISQLQKKGYGFRNGSFRRRNQHVVTGEERVHDNIFTYPTGNSGKDHPAVFPNQLAFDQIISWSNEGDLVYDPFCGSGTVPEECEKLNRIWIASEISKDYSDSATKRLYTPPNLFNQSA